MAGIIDKSRWTFIAANFLDDVRKDIRKYFGRYLKDGSRFEYDLTLLIGKAPDVPVGGSDPLRACNGSRPIRSPSSLLRLHENVC
jgi:hypothetical protein